MTQYIAQGYWMDGLWAGSVPASNELELRARTKDMIVTAVGSRVGAKPKTAAWVRGQHEKSCGPELLASACAC